MRKKKQIRNLLLSFQLGRELFFFVAKKKLYKGFVDKKIAYLLTGKTKLSDNLVKGLIVSLTSFPERMFEIKYTLFSLLDQNLLPEKIILWLADSQFPNKELDLPKEVLSFKSFGLEIHWCEDLHSYKKLIPALKEFPNHYIVTADDDLYYSKEWLRKLWLEHLKYPDQPVANTVHQIEFKDNLLAPYEQWKKNIKDNPPLSFKAFATSGGGTLYHKNYFHNDIFNHALILKLAPNADDVWFYFMALLSGNSVRVIKKPVRFKYVNPYREYGLNDGYRLSASNVEQNFNDVQIKRILDHYHIDLNTFLTKRKE